METTTSTSGKPKKPRRRKRNKNITSQPSNPPPLPGDLGEEPLPTGEYEVFLSFRGPDTRANITDILYRFLAHSRIRIFRDEDELERGERIWSNLVEAINQSKISIPIFSPRYADSKYCLQELAEIRERQKRQKGHVILPIFYKVDPREVRHQSGLYGEAFQKFETKGFDEKTLQSWRDALKEVGELKGWHIKSKTEEAAIADIVSGTVWSHLMKNNYALETDELVGIDDQVEQIVARLNLGSQGVGIVGLHGIGGIGKTTIATAVYNKLSNEFDRFSFIENIREAQQQWDGFFVLQKRFISNILGMKSVQSVTGVGETKKIMRDQVSKFKILVVLDDVDEEFDFEKLLQSPEYFHPGSRFIVTSRNIEVLRKLNEKEYKLYEVRGMDEGPSLRLFCKHAFRKDSPSSGFEKLSKEIVSTTGRLPLTLKVIGSLLFQAEKGVWIEKSKQLKTKPEKGVMDRLIISYNNIEPEAQQIFLDIACFLIGKNKEIASYMWSDCELYPITYINVLVQRSMLKIGERNEFQMHDQLRDMGRQIVREENIKHPGMRSRIWSSKEAIELLANNKVMNQVEAIRVNSESGDVSELDSGCFTNLSELRYLDAGNTRLSGDFSHLLPNLKWMQVHNHHRRSVYRMPNFNIEKLVIFDVNVEGLGDDSIKTKEAKKLKVLHLPHCGKMSKLPEFPESGSLEMLRIDYFKNKEEDLDIEKLSNLKVLRLVFCELRKIKGGTIGKSMKELRELNLNDINCNFDNFRGVIADIGELSSLEILKLKSHYLVNVLEGIKLPKSLKMLITQSGFDNLAELLDLEEFIVIGSSLKTTELVIPLAVDSRGDESTIIPWINSSKLKTMRLEFVKRIIMVESKSTMLPSSLTELQIWNVDTEQLPNLENLGNLSKLELHDCSNLQEVQGLGGMKSLEILHIYNAGKLTLIGGLGNLMSSSSCRLTNLGIHKCPLLRAVLTFDDDANANGGRESVLVRIESLLNIEINGSQSLDGRSIPRLSISPRLKVLRFEEIHLNINYKSASQQHQLLEGLENLEELVSLTVHHLPKVQRLPSLSNLIKLSNLSLQDLPSLREIVGLGELKSLKQLKVSRCLFLERLPVADLPYSTMYRIELDLRGCTDFINVDSDLSPITTRGEDDDLKKLKVIIRWPHESEEAIEKNLLPLSQSFFGATRL
ncbi:Disease resistance protein L6 [Linum perenne]